MVLLSGFFADVRGLAGQRKRRNMRGLCCAPYALGALHAPALLGQVSKSPWPMPTEYCSTVR